MNKIRYENKSKDSVIPVDEAITAHLNYLLDEDGPHIENNGKIVHFLWISKDDLKTVTDNAKNGVRLYFCKHAPDSEDLNIIVVPVAADGHNILSVNGSSVLANTLKPCPDDCPPANPHVTSFSEKDLNHKVTEDGVEIWCKPNLRDADGHIWFDKNGNPVENPKFKKPALKII